MFFLIEREDEVALHPRSFTRSVEKMVLSELRSKVQGKCTGRFGYTIVVIRVERISDAVLNEDTGWAHFKVKYLALVFRPFKNEVLPAMVTELGENGLHAQAGPQRIYVSKQGMAEDARYDPNSNPPCFVSDQQEYRVTKNSLINVKITGIRLAATEISVTGSINEDYLGPAE